MLARITQALFAALVCCLIGSQAGAQAPGKISAFGKYEGYAPELYKESVRTSFYLPMRDGVRLAVDLYRPAVNGKPVDAKFPVIWHHTLARSRGEAGVGTSVYRAVPQMTKYGYVVAMVERRGLGASFGVRRGYNDLIESYDAYEVTEWLASRNWSTGKVGIVGCSNTGAAATHALTMRPPSLDAVFAGCFAWDNYDWTLRGGIFAQWGTGVTRTLEEDMRATPVDGDESKTLLRQAAEEHQKSTSLADLWRSMPYRDDFAPLVQSRFWSEGSIHTYLPQMRDTDTVVYIQGGWRDDLRRDGLIAFNNLNPGRTFILIGDWLHCQDDGTAGVEMRRFFDFYLKGVPNGFDAGDPIHLYTVNAPMETAWRAYKSWPLANAKARTLRLGAKSTLSASASGASSFTVSHDVDCGGAAPLSPNSQPCTKPGSGVSFDSAPLAADTEVTGHPIADLWISADAPDLNLFVYLEDVAPDGSVKTITDGRLKASIRKEHEAPYKMFGLPYHRAYREDAEPLRVGVPARLRMDLFPVSYVFKAGHKMRVTVTGADYRERDRVEANTPTVTILNSGKTRSAIELPIVK